MRLRRDELVIGMSSKGTRLKMLGQAKVEVQYVEGWRLGKEWGDWEA